MTSWYSVYVTSNFLDQAYLHYDSDRLILAILILNEVIYVVPVNILYPNRISCVHAEVGICLYTHLQACIRALAWLFYVILALIIHLTIHPLYAHWHRLAHAALNIICFVRVSFDRMAKQTFIHINVTFHLRAFLCMQPLLGFLAQIKACRCMTQVWIAMRWQRLARDGYKGS